MLLTVAKDKKKIASIVAKSHTLAERLSINSINSANIPVKEAAKIEERLQHWCQVVAGGDFAKFEQRLAWAGLDIKTIRPLLSDFCDHKLPLPLWANTLEQIIEKAKDLSTREILAPQHYLDPKNPIPFEQIYHPCLQIARERLANRVDRLEILANSVQTTLERELLLQLNDLCSATLMAEFSAFRSSGNITQDFILFKIASHNNQEKYHAFIEKLFADGLLSLFEKYPVLGRLVTTAINLWVDRIEEFCDRLVTNWSEIEQSFSPQKSLKQVIEIKTGLSDPHNGGRSVMILTFNTDMKLVYKPKNLRIEAAFSQLLEWFNCQAELLPFKVIQVLNYDTHGWVEYVESLPCENEGEVRHFYQISGMLLCLINLIEGTDCHYDNLIINGKNPVLIDTETLFHHYSEISDSTEMDKFRLLANQKLHDSPLKTLMLPQWGLSSNDNLNIDLSGLGGREEKVGLTLHWENINTDCMKRGTTSTIQKEDSTLALKGNAIAPDNYLAELLAGFEDMYWFLIDRQQFLLSLESPLRIFVDLEVRYVFRATRIYHTLLHNSWTPNLLQSGIDRSIQLDAISKAYLLSDQKPDFWPILDAELQALEKLDIPFFSVSTSQANLKLPTGAIVQKIFNQASFEKVISKLQSLCKHDLEEELEIIRGSFCARFIKEPSCVISEREESANTLLSPKSTPITPEQLVQEATKIAQDLQKRSIEEEESIIWIGLGLKGKSQNFQIQCLNDNLYDGSCGVALFFAALSKITGNSDWRDLALKTLQPLRYKLQDLNSQTIKKLTRKGLGGTTGLGSIIYSLVQLGNLIESRELIKDANKVAHLITIDLIESDRHFDLMNGNAGTILSLLKLYEFEQSALETAIYCGEYLLKQQHSIGMRQDLNTGFANGAAGIVYALLRLFELTQDDRLLVGVKAAIAYEQKWQAAHSQEPIFYNNWANGAAGIGLGRLGSLSVLDTVAIRQEIDRNLTITQQYCLEDVDNLAWGNFGRIETLLVASQKLNRPELFDFVRQSATILVRQAQSRGRFNLCTASVPFAYNPGFFQGTTGIGYQLLRIAYPHLLPSVLLWE